MKEFFISPLQCLQCFQVFPLICLAFVKLEARQVCVAPLYLVWMQDKHSAGTTLKKKEKKLNLKNPKCNKRSGIIIIIFFITRGSKKKKKQTVDVMGKQQFGGDKLICLETTTTDPYFIGPAVRIAWRLSQQVTR